MPSVDDVLRSNLLGKNSSWTKNLSSLDKKLTATNHATSVLNSCIQFVPARRPYSEESKHLKSKYIRLSGESKMAKGNLENCKTRPSTSKLPNSHDANGKCGEQETTPGGDIPPPMFEIFPADQVRLNWDNKLKRSTAVGFHNLGNTCFLNSVLQVLTNTAPLANYLLNNEHDTRLCPSSTGFCALCLMKNHVQRVFSCSSGGAISPNAVVSRVRCFMKSHSVGRQEDAHEFLRYFIDSMQTAAIYAFKGKKLDLHTKETSVMGRIFGGYLKNEVTCNKCNFNSRTYDPFLDINVEVKQLNSLEAALSHFTRPETLANENAYKCPKCKVRVSARKMFTIHHAPNVLTIQLKRFDHVGKIDRFIAYPERLSLRPYMTEKQGPPVIYKLYGVVVHHGRSTRSGHYYAFVRNPCDQWHLLDDSRAAPVSPNNALKSPGAYLLFYIRAPTPVIAVKPQMNPVTRPRAVETNGKNTSPGRLLHTPPKPALIQTLLPFSPVPRSIADSSTAIKTATNGSHSTSLAPPRSPVKPSVVIVSPIRRESKMECASRDAGEQEMKSDSKQVELAETQNGSTNKPLAKKLKASKEERRKRKLRKREEKRQKRMERKLNGKIETSTDRESDQLTDCRLVECQSNGKVKTVVDRPLNGSIDQIENGDDSNQRLLVDGEVDPCQSSALRKEKKRKKKKKLKKLHGDVGGDEISSCSSTLIVENGHGEVDSRSDQAVLLPRKRKKLSKNKDNKRAKKAKKELAEIADKVEHAADKVQDIVKHLKEQCGFSYGYSVKSWSGSPNVVDQLPADDSGPDLACDDWDEEHGRRKMHKRKKKRGQFMTMGLNPFQVAQNSKNVREHARRTATV